MTTQVIVRLGAAIFGTAASAALVFGTKPPCVSDPDPCGGYYVQIGNGCSTYTNPEPPYYPECCPYWRMKCFGTSTTFDLRNGWIFSEACGEVNKGFCPSSVGPPNPG